MLRAAAFPSLHVGEQRAAEAPRGSRPQGVKVYFPLPIRAALLCTLSLLPSSRLFLAANADPGKEALPPVSASPAACISCRQPQEARFSLQQPGVAQPPWGRGRVPPAVAPGSSLKASLASPPSMPPSTLAVVLSHGGLATLPHTGTSAIWDTWGCRISRPGVGCRAAPCSKG